jgi:hypothetical protein
MSTVLEAIATHSGTRVVPSKKEIKKPSFLPPDSTKLVFVENAKTPSQPPKKIKFGMLRDRRLRMLAPITVDLDRKKHAVVARWSEIQEFGYGANASEALDDFGKTIEELFLSLNERKDRLGEDLQNVWTIMSKHIEMRQTPA